MSTTNERSQNDIVVGDDVVTVIPYQFNYFEDVNANIEIVVTKKDTNVDPEAVTVLVEGTDYDKYDDRIELTSPLLVGELLLVERVVVDVQPYDYQSMRPFPAEVHERQEDRTFMSLSELKNKFKRTPMFNKFNEEEILIEDPIDGNFLKFVYDSVEDKWFISSDQSTVDLSDYYTRSEVDQLQSDQDTALQNYADQAESDAINAAASYTDGREIAIRDDVNNALDDKVDKLGIVAGSNINITGSGSTSNPYVVNTLIESLPLTDLNILPNHSFETDDDPWTISSGFGSANFGTSGVLESNTNKRYLQVVFNDNELPVKNIIWTITDILLNPGWVGVPIKCSFWYRTTNSNIIANAGSFNEFIEQSLPNTGGQWRHFEMEFYNLTSTSYFSFALKTEATGGASPIGIDIDEIYFGPSKEERGYPGKIEQTFSAIPPSIGRWLPADGRTISRTGEYQRLFEYASTLIGPASDDLWGEGDGSTTFSIPDLNALTPRGVGTRTINGRNKVGPMEGKLQEDQMQRITGQLTKGSGIGILDTRGATVASGALSIGDETGRRRDGDDASDNARDLIFDSADSLGARASGDTDGETRVNAFGVYYWIRY